MHNFARKCQSHWRKNFLPHICYVATIPCESLRHKSNTFHTNISTLDMFIPIAFTETSIGETNKTQQKSEAQNLCSKCPPFTRTHILAWPIQRWWVVTARAVSVCRPHHCLHHLLPPDRNVCYILRDRDHFYQLIIVFVSIVLSLQAWTFVVENNKHSYIYFFTWSYRATSSPPMADGLSVWLVRRSGIPCRTACGIRLLAGTVSNNLWRRFCSQRIDAFSALEVSRRCAI